MSSEVSNVKRYDFQLYPTEQGFLCFTGSSEINVCTCLSSTLHVSSCLKVQ